jgi:threonine dehydratase
VPRGGRTECRRVLDALGYDHWDETDNPAYDLFLRAS